MEGHNINMSHSSRDRFQPRNRASSRSSNSTTSTRETSYSSTNSSFAAASPRLSQSGAPLHRQHISTGAKAASQLLKDGVMETRGSPRSSILQEKLRRERRADMDARSVASMKLSDQRTTPDPRGGTLISPIRPESLEGRLPPSAGTTEPRKKGMGVKEMEHTVSTLHKQNFDLKLELYHRRERQTVLEDRLEAMQTEKNQIEDMNDTLIHELEKRDKAVEEAVAMIVLLETQVEKLLDEREMVRRIESQTAFHQLSDDVDANARAQTPKPRLPTTTANTGRNPGVDLHTINRMPSFLSEQSETTENLRNVYIGVHGSLHSLRRPGEAASEVDKDHPNSLASPCLSVLSESSFVSIYGGAGNGNTNQETGLTMPEGRPSLDGPLSDMRPPSRRMARTVQPRAQFSAPPPTRQARSNSFSRGVSPGHFQSLADMVDQSSPLQRLEKLERAFSLTTNGSRQSSGQDTSAPEEGTPRSTGTAGSPSAAQLRTKERKREALRRVMAEGIQVQGGRPGRDHSGLPPTPDTISTTTLQRYKGSDETLSRRPSLTNQQSYLTLSEVTTSPSMNLQPLQPHMDQFGGAAVGDGTPRNKWNAAAQVPPMTAFSSRRDVKQQGDGYHFDMRRVPLAQQQQRPKSAGETTASHRNGWDSSESEGEESVASSLDIWMREGGLKPGKKGASGNGGDGHGGRTSPDLFGFPIGLSSQWAVGSGSTPSRKARGEGDLSDLISVEAGLLLQSGGHPPPPPNRRSSLHAPTGITTPSGEAILSGSSAGDGPGQIRREGSLRRGMDHGRRNSEGVNILAAAADTSAAQVVDAGQQGKAGRENHYPPTSSQQNRPRGLNRLFRRSLGSSDHGAPVATETTSAAADAATASKTPGANVRGGMGIPLWIRNGLEDERSGATPPPIQRSRGFSRGEVEAEDWSGGGVSLGPGGEAGKRKWLGAFGRTNSLRNKG